MKIFDIILLNTFLFTYPYILFEGEKWILVGQMNIIRIIIARRLLGKEFLPYK
jgi:hypothetical protein